MAHRDPLTGLGNRRQLNHTLDRLWPEAQARGESIAMLMLDIDEFKAFNDCYGHLAGDTSLQRISAAVSPSCAVRRMSSPASAARSW